MIVCDKLSKRFGEIFALRELTFSAEGKIAIFGFNGAGKSTLAKILAGIIKPSYGRVEIFGLDPVKNAELRRKIGIVTHNPMLYKELTVKENLEFFAKLYQAKDWKEVLQNLKLEEKLNSRISELSKGFAQRVAIARALLPKPKVLILDEALTGLDAESREVALSIMQEFNGILVFSTHQFEDAEFCDNFLVLDNGRLIYFGESYEKAINSLSTH
ncbi:MAG: ABC transporter ATP-binding protein [Archaeoglobaceae archaeon]|nr:ABC transporter ATP-binding protein [Archaeoglobaceae archaeon]MDW8118501.1 ABC transporter ATP-binding protein [Archaeoglobaceae archaeon]